MAGRVQQMALADGELPTGDELLEAQHFVENFVSTHRPQQGTPKQKQQAAVAFTKRGDFFNGIPVIGWLKGLPVMAWVPASQGAPRMRTTSKNHQGDDLYFLVGNLQKNLHGGAVPI